MTPHFQITLGVDLAQASFDVALAGPDARIAQWRELSHLHVDGPPDAPESIAAIVGWLRERQVDPAALRVVVESTGQLSRRFAWAWQQSGGAAVAIVNPLRTKGFGVSLGLRDKTDRIDAAVLALYGHVHRPEPTRLRSQAHEQVRELVRLRQALVEEISRWKHRQNEALGKPAGKFIERRIHGGEREIKRLDELIDELIEEEPPLRDQVQALVQIDGIGKVTARTLTAELGDLRIYSRNQLVALAGLYPKRFESGSSVWRRPRLAKGGGSRLRRVLYMCATSLFSSKGPWAVVIERWRERGMCEMKIIGILMRRLLLVARAVMLADGEYDPQKVLNIG